MKKRNQKKRNYKKKRGNVEGIVHIPFTFTNAAVTFAASSVAVELNLQCATSDVFGTRIVAIASNYQYFKCTKLHVELFSFIDTTGSNNSICYAYKPAEAGVTDTSTFTSLVESIPSVLYLENQIEPKRFIIPRKFLLDNPQRWFPTVTTGAGGYLDSVQGHFYISPRQSATIGNLLIRFSGMVSFKNPTLGSLDLHIKIDELTKKLEDAKGKLTRLSIS